MYFQNFPKTFFTVDNYKSAKLFPNLLKRTKFLNEVITNFSLFDTYNIVDGETPEITADVLYGNPELNWTLLHANDITDPRFGWTLQNHFLEKYTSAKYANVNSVHHYEDVGGNVVNGNIRISGSLSEFQHYNINDVILNNTSIGVAVVTGKTLSNADLQILTTNGGFVAGEEVVLSTNTQIKATIITADITSGIAVTNLKFEERENDNKRSIKALKAEVVGEAVSEFQSIMAR